MAGTAPPDPQLFSLTPPAALESLAIAGELDAPYLLLDLRRDSGEEAYFDWLRARPCPVLALAPQAADGPLVQACDVVAATAEALATTIANILHAPLASAVLVQTLRITEQMPIADALVVESFAYATLQAGPEFARWKAEREEQGTLPAETGEPVLLDRERDTLTLTLNRPRSRNAISVEMREALVEAFTFAGLDATISSVSVRGEGDCFSTGGEVAEFGVTPNPAEAHMIRMRRLPARALLPLAKRTTFHLHGACIGAGIEIPAFAARVHARADAFFQLPELRFGLIPGAGGCVSIPRRIGRQRTAYLALSGRRIGARTALEWGLVDEITP